MPWMSSDLSLSFLDEELKDERCKGTYLTVHRGPPLVTNWCGGHQSAPLGRRKSASLSRGPVHTPTPACTKLHFWHHCVTLQGGTRLFYFAVASVEASCENVPVEAILSGHSAALETSRSGKRIAGIMQWWGLNFLSGCDFESCDFGKELHCLSCFQELVALCQRRGYSCWINGFNW